MVATCEEWGTAAWYVVARRQMSGGGGTAAWCVEERRRRRLGWAAVTVVRECRDVSVQRGVGVLRAKALIGVLLVEMTTAP